MRRATAALLLATPFFLFFGSLSDKIGRKWIIMLGCALAVLRHRVRLAPELDIEGLSVDQVLQQLLDQVPAPRL